MRQQGALLLREAWSSWDADIGVRSDGSFVVMPVDEPVTFGPMLQIASLVVGAGKYPELAKLLPDRTSSSEDCQTCTGTGWIMDGAVVCATCSGLGWVQARDHAP